MQKTDFPDGSAQSLTNAPLDREESELGMSNYNHTIDEGFEEALRSLKYIGRHAAWDFNGLVWFDGEKFNEEVWQYHIPVKVVQADSLRDLMDDVNDEFGAG
jgi:hypothetical protein